MNANEWPMITVSNGSASLGTGILDALIEGRIGLLRLEAALPPDALGVARNGILQARPAVNRYANASLTTIGPYLANRLGRVQEYFRDAGDTDTVFGVADHDLRAHARTLVSQALGLSCLSVLVDPSHGGYAPAVVRLHGDGVSNPLHNDHIARDAAGSGLRVADITVQLSAVMCIQECDAGGQLKVFRRPWSAADEAWKVRDGLGYQDRVVDGASQLTFKPATGDIYVLNPTNYHAIAAVSGQTRITAGFFFGLFEDSPGEAFAWS